MAAIQLDALQETIGRNCTYVVDLGGYSYYLIDSPYHLESRRRTWTGRGSPSTTTDPVMPSSASASAPTAATAQKPPTS